MVTIIRKSSCTARFLGTCNSSSWAEKDEETISLGAIDTLFSTSAAEDLHLK
jgi:hypothetical protein